MFAISVRFLREIQAKRLRHRELKLNTNVGGKNGPFSSQTLRSPLRANLPENHAVFLHKVEALVLQ